jgi:signal transduction histidine kinase
MRLRFNSLKTRTAVAIASVIVAILVANAVYLILTKRAELRKQTEDQALKFALLTRDRIGSGYDTYAVKDFKFRDLMREILRLNPDVDRIQIIDIDGRIRFDSTQMDEAGSHGAEPPQRRVQDAERLAAVKAVADSILRGRDASGQETLEIVAPYREDWGRHTLSVAYRVNYKNLEPRLARLVYVTGGLTLASILMSVLIAVSLASRITKPLEALTSGVKDIAEGHFDRRLSITSHDELEILAETFNHMTGRLKQHVEQLEESNKKLGAVNEELKELDRMKSDLLANVSHELRTPLTAIKGYTDYILERRLGAITEKQEKGLVVVQRNLERLSKTINALLDFSRMDVGRIALNLQPFVLGPLLDQIVTGLRSELEKKGLKLTAEIERDLPPVIADREKLSAVLENLIINALKFTPEGGRITVSARRAGSAARPSAHIRVSDTGVGIAADQIAKIFNRFHQVDTSTTRRFGGVGLGLAIVKSILEAHGTSVTVESELGRGTTFGFVLPVLDRAELPVPAAEPARGREVVEEGPVLVIETAPEKVPESAV